MSTLRRRTILGGALAAPLVPLAAPYVSAQGGKPYAEIRLDPAKLARFGLTREQVMRAVESSLGGMPVTTSVEGALRYPVRIRYLRERRDDPDELALVQVPVTAGHGAIPLASLLAEAPNQNAGQNIGDGGLTYTIGPMAIRSEGGKRTQYVLLNAQGRGEVEVVRDADARLRLEAALADLNAQIGRAHV